MSTYIDQEWAVVFMPFVLAVVLAPFASYAWAQIRRMTS